eukprot:CAMPEP_0113897580 /NCGR_PEP_ID=MMETSP0780_2-20120614/18785_1 /TAXON_ID=652834 /ORGANISM="Palpitomonas bilix" /LENGTH=303 /DNA_ID=CAMNT_0000889113 /DNA_START=991 /DNA_END=1899 /DNA_ORIENTATION=+ /assembly_acc=CAM_ASM_000599
MDMGGRSPSFPPSPSPSPSPFRSPFFMNQQHQNMILPPQVRPLRSDSMLFNAMKREDTKVFKKVEVTLVMKGVDAPKFVNTINKYLMGSKKVFYVSKFGFVFVKEDAFHFNEVRAHLFYCGPCETHANCDWLEFKSNTGSGNLSTRVSGGTITLNLRFEEGKKNGFLQMEAQTDQKFSTDTMDVHRMRQDHTENVNHRLYPFEEARDKRLRRISFPKSVTPLASVMSSLQGGREQCSFILPSSFDFSGASKILLVLGEDYVCMIMFRSGNGDTIMNPKVQCEKFKMMDNIEDLFRRVNVDMFW